MTQPIISQEDKFYFYWFFLNKWKMTSTFNFLKVRFTPELLDLVCSYILGNHMFVCTIHIQSGVVSGCHSETQIITTINITESCLTCLQRLVSPHLSSGSQSRTRPWSINTVSPSTGLYLGFRPVIDNTWRLTSHMTAVCQTMVLTATDRGVTKQKVKKSVSNTILNIPAHELYYLLMLWFSKK